WVVTQLLESSAGELAISLDHLARVSTGVSGDHERVVEERELVRQGDPKKHGLALRKDVLVKAMAQKALAPGERTDHVDRALLVPRHQRLEHISRCSNTRIRPATTGDLVLAEGRAVDNPIVTAERLEGRDLSFELGGEIEVVRV